MVKQILCLSVFNHFVVLSLKGLKTLSGVIKTGSSFKVNYILKRFLLLVFQIKKPFKRLFPLKDRITEAIFNFGLSNFLFKNLYEVDSF